ncbi:MULTISPECIES: NADPH-dependent F420 reductase [Cupriavidus]|jgi:hypothetical protein|uniref:NADPH-dependent F420 reductase n=1 Tax=Cupriavidus pauculus TaxID=82633 RepID=A0A5P2HC95_9BURK|nr:NADPH-dependent F420 reductase [Cupriavidus pauculus]QET05646.1 NADPH-dependent F420 reductase [Cupriavidus pauculus]
MSHPEISARVSRRTVLLAGVALAVTGGLVRAQAPAAKAATTTNVANASNAAKARIGVIGSGRIGGTIGGLWVKAGHSVMFSSRHPEELKSMADKLGPLAQTGTVAQAIAFADVLLLAVPYGAVPAIGEQNASAWRGKTVLDATNAIAARDGAVVEEVQRNGIGATTSKYLRGAKIVRAFNFTGATEFARESHRSGAPLAVPIAGDDAQALEVASQLVRDAGFEPVVVGGLSTADRFAPGGKLFRQMGTAEEFRRAMAQQ